MKSKITERFGMMRTSAIGVVCLITVLGMCGCPSRLKVPTDLIGAWETSSAERYGESMFEISEKSITFVNGEEHKKRYNLDKLESTVERGQTKYDIQYSDNLGGDYQLTFNYVGRGDDPQIRFKYQPKIVWTRVVLQ